MRKAQSQPPHKPDTANQINQQTQTRPRKIPTKNTKQRRHATKHQHKTRPKIQHLTLPESNRKTQNNDDQHHKTPQQNTKTDRPHPAICLDQIRPDTARTHHKRATGPRKVPTDANRCHARGCEPQPTPSQICQIRPSLSLYTIRARARPLTVWRRPLMLPVPSVWCKHEPKPQQYSTGLQSRVVCPVNGGGIYLTDPQSRVGVLVGGRAAPYQTRKTYQKHCYTKQEKTNQKRLSFVTSHTFYLCCGLYTGGVFFNEGGV